MFMIIDVTGVENTTILSVGTLAQITYIAKLLAAPGRKLIAPEVGGKGFSKLEKEQLQYLFYNHTGEEPPEDYAMLVESAVYIANQIEPDDRSLERLEKEVRLIDPDYCPEEPRVPKEIQEKEKPSYVRRQPGEAAKPYEPTGAKEMQLWQMCDDLFDLLEGSPVDWKVFRHTIMEQCEEAGISTNTGSVYYASWKREKIK